MTQAHIDKVKEELLSRKLQLEEELKRISEEKISDGQSQDDGDQALAATLETLRSSFQDTQYEEYMRINDALRAIDEGRYGICQDCEKEISEKRLKYYPNARRCLACQESAEEE